MAYCTQIQIQAEIGLQNLAAMTDDTGAGVVNAATLNQLIQNASFAIDGSISNIYSVPFGTPPEKVRWACIIFVCEKLYQRRLTPDEKNPYKKQADDLRDIFKKIGNGELELDLNFPRNYYQGTANLQPTIFAGNSPWGGCGSATTM